MTVYGYAGQILYVDLTNGTIRKEPLDLGWARKHIGGFGFTVRLVYELLKPGADPLSPGNVIAIGAGALGGTMALGCSRISAATKFPETGAIGSACGSLSFAPRLKMAGFDAIAITGRAPKPVYLLITDDKVELRDAAGVWGQDLYDATDEIWRRHGSDYGVIAIGQAGENLVKLSLTLIDKSATLGKGGMGAVFGSKNLKAVAVKGTGGIAVADPKRFMRIVEHYLERVRAYPLRDKWVELGINFTWPDAKKTWSYWKHATEAYPSDKADQMYGWDVYLREVKKSRDACPSCPIADKEVYEVRDGEFKGLITYASGFTGRATSFGNRLQVGGADKVIKAIDAANRYGIDSHSGCAVMDYIIYLYEQGKIRSEDIDGMVLRRDLDTTLKLLKQIAFREGLGKVLADGELAVMKRFGQDIAKESLTVKGMELWMEARVAGLGTMEFESIVNPRGAHHSSGGSPAYSADSPLDKFGMHCERMGASKEAAKRILDSPFGFNVGRLTRYSEDWYGVLSSLGLCNRAQTNRFHSIGSCAELYSAATGFETSPQEMAQAGERTWNVLKACNVREGFSRKDDIFPEPWFGPMKTLEGGEQYMTDYFKHRRLNREDCERALDDFYAERGWDKEKGIPTKAKLLELGLDVIASDLEKRGFFKR